MSRASFFGRFVALGTRSDRNPPAADRGWPATIRATVTGYYRRFGSHDPFASTRRRLLAWNVLVIALIVLIIGTFVYLRVAKSRSEEVDQELQAAATSELVRFAGHERSEQETYPLEGADVFLIVSDTRGRILLDPRAASPSGFPVKASLDLAMAGRPNFASVAIKGTSFRVYSAPLYDRGQLVGAVQAGKGLADQERELRDLLVTMLVGGLVSVVLATAGGFFLVELALVPARRAFARQQQFVADASHELRTPIALIKATADVLGRDPDQPIRANQGLLTDIEREADHLGRLIGDLLQLARLDSGQLEAELVPVSIGDVAQEAVAQVQRLGAARGLRLGVTGQTDLWVMADLGRLRQVLLILLDNAVKHTPSGGSVQIHLQRDHGAARLVVADTGEGIAPEHIPHVFERFYRVDKARARADGGVGLGLAIARELVELQGGRIRVESVLGKGSSFIVWMPLARG